MKIRRLSEVAELLPKQGWHRGAGDEIYWHPTLGKVLAVAICRDNGTPVYDQFLHYEPVGAITVPVNTDDAIGLITVERPSFNPGAPQTFPNLDVTTLGAPSIEVPRGFPKKGESGAQTATREGEEELASPIVSVTQIGAITPNTTFHPHRIPVYCAVVNHRFTGTTPPDVNEKILKVAWYPPEEVKYFVRHDKIRCAMTLASLMLHLTT